MTTAAEAFVAQLVACGADTVFGNPGTTEYAVLDAIGERDDIELILALHEGVAVSAAAGYARATGRVGVVELHAGPGLGNGMGMIYDAWAGQTPLLVYVGQVDQSAAYLEPTLGADLVAMATPVTKWAYEIRTPDEVPQVVRRAMKVALTPPYGPVMLSLPMDVSERPCAGAVEPPGTFPCRVRPDPDAVARAAQLVLAAESPLIVPGDGVVRSGAQRAVSRLAQLIGAPIRGGTMAEAAVDPAETLATDRLHHGGAETRAMLAGHDVIIAVGTKVFTQLFPLAGDPAPDSHVVHIGLDPWELGKSKASTVVFGDEGLALDEIADRVAAAGTPALAAAWRRRGDDVRRALAQRAAAARDRDRARWDERPMSPARACYELVQALPDGACVVDETITVGGPFYRYYTPQPGRWFRARGGGIGEGMPMALGVQRARPGAPVVALVGDGSSMYAITALWTAAHHDLPVTWVILNNSTYQILRDNAVRRRPADRAGLPFIGTSLTGPPIDFVTVARGLGVEAVRVSDPAGVGAAVRHALGTRRPALIDLVISAQ